MMAKFPPEFKTIKKVSEITGLSVSKLKLMINNNDFKIAKKGNYAQSTTMIDYTSFNSYWMKNLL